MNPETYEIQVETVAAQTALVIKNQVGFAGAGAAIEKSLKQVESHLAKTGVAPQGGPFVRTLEIADGKISYEAGFPVKGPKSDGKVTAVTLQGGVVVKTVHRGKPEESEKGYEALHAWMKKNGKRPAGAPWETYGAAGETQIFYPIQ